MQTRCTHSVVTQRALFATCAVAAITSALLLAGCAPSEPSGPAPVSQQERIKAIDSNNSLPPEAKETIKQQISKESPPQR